jgi:hypothetical protein
MRGGDRATVEAFDQAVAAIPHVGQAQRLFGEPGYLLRVITANLPAFPGGLGNRLATLPGVQRLSSTLVMKSVVENRPLPLYQNRWPPNWTGLRSSSVSPTPRPQGDPLMRGTALTLTVSRRSTART